MDTCSATEIRHDHLLELLLAGAASAPAGPADASYFAGLSEQAIKARPRA